MNERIKELAEQAGFYFDEYNESTQRKVELLAHLIVKECADIGHLYEGGEYQVRTQILAHFGVHE